MSQGASNAISASSTATGLLVTAVPTAETAVINTISQAAVYEVTGANSQGLRVRGVINFTAGATGTGVTIKLRQGVSTTSGTQVGTSLTHTLANNASAQIPFDFIDTAPSAGNQNYCLTLTSVGLASTLNAATIGVEVADQTETGSI